MAAPPSSPGAFSPANIDFSSRLAANAHSSVLDLAATRVIPQRPTDTGRSSSAKRLCTSDELLRTSLEVPTIASRALPDGADADIGRSTRGMTTRLLVFDYKGVLPLVSKQPSSSEHYCRGQSPIRECALLSPGHGALRVESPRCFMVSMLLAIDPNITTPCVVRARYAICMK